MAKKIIAVALSVVLMVQIFVIGATAKGKKYIITNPYDAVDWDEWGSYKFQPHCQTNASDGYLTIKEFVQMHYDLNYDVVALTDHGTINRGWNKVPDLVPLVRLVKYERTHMAPIDPLSDEEYDSYLSGTAASTERTHKNGMLDVPQGIELNMATPKADCHLTGYFSDYGQGLAGVYGDYETPSKGVREAGGISMLSHVGEYVYTDKDSADHVGQKVDDYYANKFARLFLDNAGSSIGMGINSATDAHTRCDRILYDQILQKTIPNGVELNGMEEMPGFDEDKVYDEKLYLLDNTPMVTRIDVDQDKGTIRIEGTNFDRITWVSNGNVIKREENITNGTATLNLYGDELLNDPYLYIRFYITGENGICYAQPFVLSVEGEEFTPVEVPETHDISTFLRGLATVTDWLFFRFNPIIWIFKYVALGYNVFDRFFHPY